MRKILFLLFTLIAVTSFSQSTTVVISQVYGGGGGSTGTYLNDYVELHNISNTAQSLNGMSLQYGSSTGNFGASSANIYSFPAGTMIPAGGYLLVQLGAAGTGGAALPVTPDLVTTNISMSAASGKIALVNQTAGLGCGATASPCISNPLIIDLVSYGASNNGEGGTTVNNGTALTNTQGAVRKNNGCTETNNNNLDFDVITAPVPRNSSSTVFLCAGSPAPSLSASSLASFGNVCINTTAGPNSFTITGSNLSTANVTVASLPGFTYSTTSGGTYTNTLSFTQSGGSFSQQVFVKFDPTAVQSYNGNIVISGGGASSINVPASGAGVNSAPAVTTGAASGITTNTATVAGTITDPGCTAVTAYGIEYSTTSGFANGTGTQVASGNLTGTNFSSSLSGLNPATTYYYKAYATNAAGTTWGSEMSFTTSSLSPTLSASSLSGFGNVCVNTTAATVQSFTITGTNLTNANIVIGPLAGFSFATSATGPFTNSLNLTQPGGSYSQQVFVQFSPTAVQSYNGNIPVSGGGATAINVAVTGSGVNSAPTVTTGTATSVTTTTASVGGAVTNNGCSALTAYGIEYSTSNNFPTGSGTQVLSSNITGGNFTSVLTGLSASTTYYYRAFATNGGGASYGLQQSFITTAPPPATLAATPLTAFGSACVNTVNGPNSFTITGSNLTSANITVGPLAGFTFSTTANGTYTPTLTVTPAGGTVNQVVYVKFIPPAVQNYNGNIPVSGGGASSINVAVNGAGTNAVPSVTTGPIANLTTNSVVVGGVITDAGCSPVDGYGVEYSGINGFTPGTGTKVHIGNVISSGTFTTLLDSLVQGATYYFRAYATNAGGIGYGSEQSFTVKTIPNGFTVYPTPVRSGQRLRFSMNNVKQGYIGIELYNTAGQRVFRQNFNTQVNFVNDFIVVPQSLPTGVYAVRIFNDTDVLGKTTILVNN